MPHLSKILERIVHHQVISHLEEFKLLPDLQSAYSRGHSTESCPRGIRRSYRRHLKWKICFAASITPNRGIRHGRPLHPAAPDNIRLRWRSTPVDVLIPRRPSPVFFFEAIRLPRGQRYIAYLKALSWGHCYLRFTRPTLARSSSNMV